jgi:hypothetical protein
MGKNDRSNVSAEVTALLGSAREHYYRGVEEHRLAADKMAEAKALDPKLSLRTIATALGVSHSTVSRLLEWRLSGADRTTSAFGGDHSRLERAVRQARREHPEMLVQQVLQSPGLLDRIIGASAEAAADVAPGEPTPVPRVLQKLDTVRMGDHVLVVGDATRAGTKLSALVGAGLPFEGEFFGADAAPDEAGDGEMDVVLVTDQPYGQDKEGIANDHIANWGPVYSLFKPRGGFVFCAFHPPFFRAAEDGIIEAGGKPVEYLALDKGGGRMWGGDRVQNRLDAVIYFERAGTPPWPSGRRAVALLTPDRSPEAVEERRRIGGDHPTAKYIDVLVKLIELSTTPGDIVLDPFAGSGTTLIACERAGRRFIGVDLDPKWADLTVRNWQRETGRDAFVDCEFGAANVRFNDMEANPALRDEGI